MTIENLEAQVASAKKLLDKIVGGKIDTLAAYEDDSFYLKVEKDGEVTEILIGNDLNGRICISFGSMVDRNG